MHQINPHKTGLALGMLAGVLHVLWSILVALGWAQPLINFSAWAHMVSVPVVVKDFELTAAATVIVVAALVGYVVGQIFARVWNRIHQQS